MSELVRGALVDLDWGQVHARGNLTSDRQPLLLLHQNPLSSYTYESVLAPLAARFRAVAVDTPGFGRSDAPGGPWTIAEYATILRQVGDRLGMRQPIVAGQHTGACLAIEMALQAPERIAGLVLVGVPCVSPATARERLAGKQPYQVAADGSHLGFLWHRMNHVQYPGQLPADRATRHLADHLLAGPENYLHAYAAVYTYPIQDRLRALRGSGIPVLLLAGEHDCIKPIHDTARDYLPEASAVTMPGLSDFLMDEDPAGFTRHLTAFADTLGTPPAQPPQPVHTDPVTAPAGGRAGPATARTGAPALGPRGRLA